MSLTPKMEVNLNEISQVEWNFRAKLTIYNKTEGIITKVNIWKELVVVKTYKNGKNTEVNMVSRA